MQRQVESRGHPGAGKNRPVLDEDAVVEHAGARLDAAQFLDVRVMRGALAPGEETSVGGEHAPGAHAQQQRRPGTLAQPQDYAPCRGCLRIDTRTGEAGEHEDCPRCEMRWQRLKTRELQPDGGCNRLARRDEAQTVAALNAARRVAECFRRAGHIEQHYTGQHYEHDVDGAARDFRHRYSLERGADSAQSRAAEVVTTCAKRPSSTSSVRSRISATDTSRPWRVRIGKVSVASVT